MKRLVSFISSLSPFWRKVLLVFIDAVLIYFSIYFSFWLRFEGKIPAAHLKIFYTTIIPIIITKIIIFYFWGLYRQLWRYASIDELVLIFKAVLTGSIAILLPMIFQKHIRFFYPRSVVAIDFFLCLLLIGGVRFALRIFTVKGDTIAKISSKKRILIIGAGKAGNIIRKEISNYPELGMRVVGFIDDDPAKWGHYIGGKKIFGGREKIEEVVKKHKVDEIIIAMPSVSPKIIREIISYCEKTKAKFRILPGTAEVIRGDVKWNQLREVAIEDLLERNEVDIKATEAIKYLIGKRVLVTGAGGSIGSEISRQVALLKPKMLLLLGRGESSIFEIKLELSQSFPELDIVPIICNIENFNLLKNIFSKYNPEVVFHAAAHKHVPFMEDYPAEAFLNNVIGTQNLFILSDRYKVANFVLISTDKAVNPISAMGISKRICEMMMQIYSNKSKTKFVAVRFGNVIESRGSVIPLFKRQILAGGPITITDKNVTRYFMTIKEATSLVLQAGGLGEGGEIFILDMGEPIKIYELAKNLITLLGYVPEKDIGFKIIGLREGEKLHEELYEKDVKLNPTKIKKIFVATKKMNLNKTKFIKKINALKKDLYKLSSQKIHERMKEIVKLSN